MKCIVCQTHEQRDDSSFCSYSCATVHIIVTAEHLVLSSEELKQLGLNRLQTLGEDYIIQDIDSLLYGKSRVH